MAASDFYVYSPLAKADIAFGAATADAAWESGHGRYTGTIAEKNGFQIVTDAPKFDNPRAALTWANDDLEVRDNDKWGPAWGFPVYKPDTDFKEIQGWVFYGWASD